MKDVLVDEFNIICIHVASAKSNAPFIKINLKMQNSKYV